MTDHTDDRPWELLNGRPLRVGDEVRQDLRGITRIAVVASLDGGGDPWAAEGDFIGVLQMGTWYVRRPVQVPPTEPGTVIVPADGHEYIEASSAYVRDAQHCREAVYEDPYYYGVWWRDGKAVHNGWLAENITPGTWKVEEK